LGQSREDERDFRELEEECASAVVEMDGDRAAELEKILQAKQKQADQTKRNELLNETQYKVTRKRARWLAELLWSGFNHMFQPESAQDGEEWARVHEPVVAPEYIEARGVDGHFAVVVRFYHPGYPDEVSVSYEGPVRFDLAVAQEARTAARELREQYHVEEVEWPNLDDEELDQHELEHHELEASFDAWPGDWPDDGGRTERDLPARYWPAEEALLLGRVTRVWSSNNSAHCRLVEDALCRGFNRLLRPMDAGSIRVGRGTLAAAAGATRRLRDPERLRDAKQVRTLLGDV
jgi:hypothetical protein